MIGEHRIVRSGTSHKTIKWRLLPVKDLFSDRGGPTDLGGPFNTGKIEKTEKDLWGIEGTPRYTGPPDDADTFSVMSFDNITGTLKDDEEITICSDISEKVDDPHCVVCHSDEDLRLGLDDQMYCQWHYPDDDRAF